MHKITLLFLLVFAIGWSQERSVLKGKVISELTDLEGIYITNLSTDATVTTSEGGYFSIFATAGDTLRFSAIQFVGKSVRLKTEDFSKELYFVSLEAMINQLEEVKILQYKNISAEALGIIPKGIKRYTPAERRLQSAAGYGGIGPGASLDPIINAITGRTAMLKKEVKVERKEMLLVKVESMFEPEFFTQTLKIPEAYVPGFCYYIVENSKFASAVNNKNRTMATFLIGDLATEYLRLIADEK